MDGHSHLPHSISSLRCEWLWVYSGWVPTTNRWSKDIVVPPGVFFVLEGLGKIKTGSRQLELPPGSLFFGGPGPRRQWFADQTRLLSVGFRATWPDGTPLLSKGLNVAATAADFAKLEADTRTLFRSIHRHRRTVGYHEAIRTTPASFIDWCEHEAAYRRWFASYAGALQTLGLRPMVREHPHDQRLREVVRRLDAWPLHRTLHHDTLLTGLKVGTRRMEQLLVATLGTTPSAYLNRRRIESAKQLLASDALSLKEVAHQLGIRHASHFTKWFRRAVGMTPSAFREGGLREGA